MSFESKLREYSDYVMNASNNRKMLYGLLYLCSAINNRKLIHIIL